MVSSGAFNAAKAEVSTYYLVGPDYFLFFIAVMCVLGVVFVFYAMAYKDQDFVRTEETPPSEPAKAA